MTLTQNGKNYIATTFGNSSNCYISSGLNWCYTGTDNQIHPDYGGTAQIVSRLILTSLVQSLTYNGQNYIYNSLKTANDNTDLTLSDAQWIAQNDGTPAGEAQYCQTEASTGGSISCTTTPSGAAVALDGVSQGVVTPTTLTNISAGIHIVTFTLSGYNSCQVSVTVTAGSTATASCNLTPGTTGGIILCTTTPSGASISLDGVNQGIVTPAILINITPGSHNVTFTLSGYNLCIGSVTVIEGYIVMASCTMTLAATGSILCTTTPSGAPITLDGTNVGMVTPATLLNISAGSHTIIFTLVGYNACSVFVNVAAGSTSTANCTLTSGTCNTPRCKAQMD